MEKTLAGKQKRVQNSRLFFKVCFLMFALVALQLLVFVVVLLFSGEFSAIKRFSYNVLLEKTQNRAGYIENLLNRKTSLVHEKAGEVNRTVGRLLEREGKTVGEVRSDRELNKKIIAAAAESIVSLIRMDMANDAFLYLNTGNLYESDGVNRLTGFYIRDTDVNSNDMVENEDLYLEMGSSELAGQFGITMDYEWSLYTELTKENDFRFFTEPVAAWEANPELEDYNFGYWSGLSRISRSAEQSIKYTVPLVLDGEVYGVIGIGLLEKNILSNIPASDFLNESACYVLATDFDGGGIYQPLLSSGAAYPRLVSGDQTIFDKACSGEYGLYRFNTRVPSIGSLQDIKLYSPLSPFKGQKWALISVADSDRILEIYHKLIEIFIISSVISVLFSALFAVLLSRRVAKPIVTMIRTLGHGAEGDQIVQFTVTGITEFDRLAESIVDLQVKVREQAFRVSDILSIADSGIGVFMYDYEKGNVFVGRSLIKILDLPGLVPEKDVTIPFADFREYMKYFDENYHMFELEVFSDDRKREETFGVNLEVSLSIRDATGEKLRWFRFTLTRDKDAVTGLVQDITKAVLERQKIEHERDYDMTTGLFNRRAFYQKVQELFMRPANLGTAAFLMLDLDNLKFVNDTYGHDFGDDYIRTAAMALCALGRENAVVARLSGDEFIAFLYGGETKEEIRGRLSGFAKTLRESYCLLADGTHYKVRASGGISWYPEDSKLYEELVKYADFAMYTIKHSTKGNFAEFDAEAYRNDSILITGIEEMNRIIDNGDIRYAFQPILSAKTGEVFGYEALMRPQSKTIPSVGEFIRIAKSAAKLYQLERLTWFLGLASFSELAAEGKVKKDAHIFLNSISNCTMGTENRMLVEEKYRPLLKNIVLEVLEGEQTNMDYANRKRKVMESWGAMIALDDFGTGYNSEYALITMNPDMIKVDRSIISNCDHDTRKRMMVQNLVGLAKERGILVLAEGVETRGEMETVIACGVDLLQGYYFAKPMFEPEAVREEVIEEIFAANRAKEKGVEGDI